MSRPRPRRAMRPPLAVRVARMAIPTVVITALGVGVAAAVLPGEEPKVAYPAPASTASVESSPSETSERSQQPSRLNSRKPLNIASVPKPKSSSSETMTPTLSLKVVDTKYATTELNVRTQASADSSVVAVVKKGTKLSVTKTIIDGFRYVSYHGKGRWVKNQYLTDTKPKSTTSSSGSGGISQAPAREGPLSSPGSRQTRSGSIVPSVIATPSSQASSVSGLRAVTTERVGLWTA